MNRPSPLEELLHGCLNGTLDETQERELARHLRESGDARRSLRSFLRIEGGLLVLAEAGKPGETTRLSSVESEDTAAADRAPPGTDGPLPRRRPFRRPPIIGLAAVAAAVLLAAGAVRWFAPSRPPVSPGGDLPSPPVVAEVVGAEGKVEVESPSGQARPAAVREPLRAGDSLRTGEGNSTAVLELADTTRLELSPETCIRLPEDGTGGVQLIQGVLRGIDGARAGRPPLVVTTPALKVRVEGDRYTLSSTSPETLRVDLEAGKAEVVRRRDQKSRTVESGATVRVQADEDMISGPMPQLVAEPRRVLDFPGAWAVFFEPDGRHLLAASYREIQRFGPGPTPEKTPLSNDTGHGRLAAFSRDGGTLAVYRGLRKEDPVIVWDVRTKQQRAKIEASITDRRFALAPDASWLATEDREESLNVCHLWDAKTGGKRFSFRSKMRINCLAAAPGGDLLAVGCVDLGRRERNEIVLLDTRTGGQAAVLPTRAFPLTAMAFSPDGRYLAAGITGLIQIWDIQKNEVARSIRGFERVLLTLSFSPDGTLLAGGTQDGQVWVWDAGRGEEVQVIQAGVSGVRLLSFSPDGRSVVTGGMKHHPLMIWDALPPRAPQPEPPRPTRT